MRWEFWIPLLAISITTAICQNLKKFSFKSPPQMIDKDLELILHETHPADPIKDYCPAYEFYMINHATREIMGYINFRCGHIDGYHQKLRYGGHIGYRVNEEYRGNGYAARSVKLLLPFAKLHSDIIGDIIWITCNPNNIASRKSCERAGGKLVEIANVPIHDPEHKKGNKQVCRYSF